MEVNLRKSTLVIVALGITTALVNCSGWLSKDRRSAQRHCEDVCGMTFPTHPQHYDMCMNAGLQPDGYYNRDSCDDYVRPHQHCRSAGYVLPPAGQNGNTAYADCVAGFMRQQAEFEFTREQNQRNRTSVFGDS